MTVVNEADAFTKSVAGVVVRKTAAILPATGLQTLFTITGGLVLVTALFGQVTTVFDGTVNSLNVVHDPDVGAVGDLNAATVCTSDIAGTLYTVLGIQASLMGSQKEGGTEVPTHVLAKNALGGGFVLPSGVTKLQSTATDTTGATKWYLAYVPLDSGARVVSG